MRERIDQTTTHQQQPRLPVGVALSPVTMGSFVLDRFSFEEEEGGGIISNRIESK